MKAPTPPQLQGCPGCRAINWIIFSLASPQSQAENPSGSSRRCWVESWAGWFFPCAVFLSWHVSLGFAGTSPPPDHELHNDDSLEERAINALLLPFPPPGLFSLPEKAKNLNKSQNCGMVWVERTLNLITASTVPSNLDLNTFYLFFSQSFYPIFSSYRKTYPQVSGAKEKCHPFNPAAEHRMVMQVKVLTQKHKISS